MALLTGLIGYWTLNEASGPRFDSKDNSTLVDVGSVGVTAGIAGNAANFSGTNYLTCPSGPNNTVGQFTDDFTLNCWARFTDNATNYTLIGKGNGTAAGSEYWLINESGTLFCFIGDGAGYGYNFISVTAATVYMITVRVTRSPFHVYLNLNDSTVASNFTPFSYTGGSITGAALNIGAVANGSLPMKGWADEVGLWRRSCSDGEVTSLFAAGVGNPYPFGEAPPTLTTSLISYWPLSEASGSANAVDSADSNTLTQENTPAALAGGYREFNSASSEDFVHASNSSLQTGDIDFTIAISFYLYDLTTVQTLLSKYGDTTDLEYALFFLGAVDATRRFAFVVDDASQNETVLLADSAGPPAVNTLYHLAAWHDATNNVLGIEVSGVSDTVGYSAGLAATSAPFRIGALGDTPGLFADGKGQKAAFWKRVLSSAERVTFFDTGIPASVAGFDGVIPLGFYALMPNWSSAAPAPGGAVLNIWRASYAIYHQRGG